MWLIYMHELFTESTHTQRKSKHMKQYHLPSYMSTVSTVRMCSSTNFEPILLCRPHPSMQVNSSCSNSPLQWRRSRSARTSNLPPDYDKEQTSSLASLEARWHVACMLSRPLETRGASRRSFENASLWPPLFVHTALQF